MRNYQILSLIGCIFGILITLAWGVSYGYLVNMEQSLTNSETSQFAEENAGFAAGLFFAFIIYIVLIVLTFTMKKSVKALGIILIVGAIINTAITNLWGIIALALILPAGVVALRYKPSTKRYRIVELDEEEQEGAASSTAREKQKENRSNGNNNVSKN